MRTYALSFMEIGRNQSRGIGGKGANLIEISKIEGIKVPQGFCITTKAYIDAISCRDEFKELIRPFALLKLVERDKIESLSSSVRAFIEEVKIPSKIEEEIIFQLKKLGEDTPCAVRSSATAEDLPAASFAGQHDTYLNIIGREEIMKHISKCWASLYTSRAVTYRLEKGFDHRSVLLSVVVQPMISPRASGIMFTADPITSNRKILSIDAGYGLGEALVSGLVSGDNYRVKNGKIIDKVINYQNIAIVALKDGGVEEKILDSKMQNVQTLTDKQILELELLGRKIEKEFSCPQDIEWCLQDNDFFILQSRPITTLYPLPDTRKNENRLYISSGHLQMMTDPIKPLGMFFFESISGDLPTCQIGGRSYCDITYDMASPIYRKMAQSFVKMIGDELMANAVVQAAKRKGFIKSLPRGKNKVFKPKIEGGIISMMRQGLRIYRENDPENIVKLIRNNKKSIEKLKEEISRLKGNDLFDFIFNDQMNLKKNVVYPECSGALVAALLPMMWFNKKIEKWLGDKNVSDRIIQSVPNSITSDTGLGLMDVADRIRQYPAVLEYLENADNESFFQNLSKLEGGSEVSQSFREYLDKYGVRCTGDIDITRPRWSEEPTALIPIILNNIKNFEPGARKRVFQEGKEESEKIILELAERLEKLPGGKRKARKITKVASIIRNHIGFREFPKYAYMQRYFIYKEALLKEADQLVEKNVIKEKYDIYYLTFDELRDVVNGNALDPSLISKRKEEYEGYEKLTPPRVMTSSGEIISGQYDKREIPEKALPGLPVSAGLVEGRARIIMSLDNVDLDEGDILITTFTDPSWTPVFASIKALVTEVGGIATHGAIIAREYGLPAVVSVENATKLIKDGQMIRVDGTNGYIEVLDDA